MVFLWGLLCHFHNKVSATAEFIRLITFKGKCEADLHCSSGPVQKTTSCPQLHLWELCPKSLHNFSHGRSHQPVPLHGRSSATCLAELTPRPSCSLPVQARGLVLCLLSFKLAFLQKHWQWGQASLTVPSAMLAWAGSPFKCTRQHEPRSWSNGRRGGLFVGQGRRGDASSGQQRGQGSSKGMQSLGPGGRRGGYREGRRKVPLTRWCHAQHSGADSKEGGWTLIPACRLFQCQQMKAKILESVRFLTYLILCWGSKRPLTTLCLELQSDIRGFVLSGSRGVLLYWSVF